MEDMHSSSLAINNKKFIQSAAIDRSSVQLMRRSFRLSNSIREFTDSLIYSDRVPSEENFAIVFMILRAEGFSIEDIVDRVNLQLSENFVSSRMVLEDNLLGVVNSEGRFIFKFRVPSDRRKPCEQATLPSQLLMSVPPTKLEPPLMVTAAIA